jgi:hypothetical protein
MIEPDDLPASAVLADIVRELLKEVGEDSERDGLRDTPERVARSLAFLTQGYNMDPREVVGTAMFAAQYDEMVVVRDVEIYSLCEHHLLPFFGRCHIAYLPREKIVGLSKLARLAEVFARRLQVQERLTTEIDGDPGHFGATRRGRRRRSAAPLHDDAGHRKAEQPGRHELHARPVSHGRADARRVP